MSSVVRLSPGLEDLRPTSRGITIIPRIRSASHTPKEDLQGNSDLKSDSVSSVQSVADENLSLAHIESMLSQKVRIKKDDLKAAFRGFDQERRNTVTKGEFRRVIEGFLMPLTQSQFNALLAKIPKTANGAIPYMEFLRQYCRVSSASIRIPSAGSHRSWPLGELQCHLKDKIGGNLKNILRAFCLFDYNRDGRIQKHELRRVLESYCFPLSQQEFHRLWSHYSPSNSHTISYKEFLERLGVDCENYRKIAPDSAKLALNWDAVNQSKGYRPKSRTLAWTASAEPEDSVDEIYSKFLKEMGINHTLVEKALQALDITDSGVVTHDDLKSVLSSFLFPISDSTFLSLLSRFGLNPTEPVEWRMFIDLFREKEQMLSVGKDPDPSTPDFSSIEEVLPRLQEQILKVFPLLKKGFLVFDENRIGVVSKADMRRVLEGLTFRLTDEQFRGLIDLIYVGNSGTICYQPLLDFFQQQKTSVDEKQYSKFTDQTYTQSQPSTAPPTATAAWNTVEGILKEKLNEQHDLFLQSLSQTDPTQSCKIPIEAMRTLLQQYGLPLSDRHFNNLCEPFTESGEVNYKLLLVSLGISMKRDTIKCANKSPSPRERNESVCGAHAETMRRQAVVNVVLRKLRDRLQVRGVTLEHCLKANGRSSAAILSLQDFQKILDECRISLQESQFQTLIQALGFYDGQVSFTEFVAKYEESISKDNNEEERRILNYIEANSFMSAEDCFSQLEKRIKECHGDVLTAFRLMDKNRDGLVNQTDFRVLLDSLMFVTKEKEYQRVLELMGFKPGSNLNYTEFLHKIRSNEKNKIQPIANMTDDQLQEHACDQVHAYLVDSASTGWSEFSKAFNQYGEAGETIITKNDLKNILYKYSLPITPRVFEKIWTRYDNDGKGHITVTEFLDKLNITPQEFTKQHDDPPDSNQTLNTSCMTPLMDTTLHKLQDWLKLSFEDVCRSLVAADKKHDGHVTVSDLLSLLRKHGFRIEECQLLHLINSIGVDVCNSKLSYLDFLKCLTGPVVSSRPEVSSQVSQNLKVRSTTAGEDVEELSPERALQRVRELVTTSSLTLSKAFKAFDKSEDGKLSQSEFRRVLDHFCVRLSDVQFRKLLSKLSIKDGEETTVVWKEFMNTFDLCNQETSKEWLEKVQRLRFPNQANPVPISDILKRIQDVVSGHLYTITKEMMDLDYASINTISKEHFKVFCDHHFMRLSADQFEKLWKLLPVNAYDNLNYREFLKKFSGELIEQAKPAAPPTPEHLGLSESSPAVLLQRPKTASCIPERSKSLSPEQLKRPSTVCGRLSVVLSSDIAAVERRLRFKIRICWREIQRRCKEADTQRTGGIEIEAFLDILRDLHIDVTQSQFEQLSEKYNMKNKGRLSYPEFLQNFVLMLKPNAPTFTERRRLHLPKTPMSAGPLSRQCTDALLRLCSPIQLRWKSIKRAFVFYDKERTGKIPLQEFRKVLRQHNVNLSEEDFFHLASFFDKNISGNISYNEFLCIFQK
ncbi:EF-hand calcium-binding domain-containing protein 6 [Astyanax mexicanus]|uniref:EF-hand calcium-binding domain-containing protein 6 n=1 Tax=Astyanax mexicanus TaxID=7994 RepID=UPI0020CB4633|nr:EF-hand calcium-binding domain-containing protein 6 [Astyanax mexicanus]